MVVGAGGGGGVVTYCCSLRRAVCGPFHSLASFTSGTTWTGILVGLNQCERSAEASKALLPPRIEPGFLGRPVQYFKSYDSVGDAGCQRGPRPLNH